MGGEQRLTLLAYRGLMACVFCDIIAGKAPAIRIYEDDDYIAFLDIRPFARGHTLVVPKQHYENLVDTPPDVVAGLARLGQQAANQGQQQCNQLHDGLAHTLSSAQRRGDFHGSSTRRKT